MLGMFFVAMGWDLREVLIGFVFGCALHHDRKYTNTDGDLLNPYVRGVYNMLNLHCYIQSMRPYVTNHLYTTSTRLHLPYFPNH